VPLRVEGFRAAEFSQSSGTSGAGGARRGGAR
jgi:hypothetical protein